jgi:hypothetical protein
VRDICELQRGERTASDGMNDWRVKSSRMRAACVVLASISGPLAHGVVLLLMIVSFANACKSHMFVERVHTHFYCMSDCVSSDPVTICQLSCLHAYCQLKHIASCYVSVHLHFYFIGSVSHWG